MVSHSLAFLEFEQCGIRRILSQVLTRRVRILPQGLSEQPVGIDPGLASSAPLDMVENREVRWPLRRCDCQVFELSRVWVVGVH